MPKIQHIVPFLLLLLTSCGNTEMTPRHIERLDIAANPYEEDADAVRALEEILQAKYSDSPATEAFAPIIQSELPELDSVELVLGSALHDFPDLKLVAVVSPYNQSVMTHPDGYVFIATNHYLGSDNPVYAGRFAAYERQRKTLRRLPSDVLEAVLASKYPPQYGSSPTLLNHMLYRGALLRAVLESMPEGTSEASSEATVLAMSDSDYAQCLAHEGEIWKALIDGQMLYSTDPALIDRLLAPAPSSPMISGDAPGQAALFTALQIAKKSPRKGVDLLTPEYYNNNQSLIDSQYAPR